MKKKIIIWCVVAVLVLAAAGVGIWYFWLRDKPVEEEPAPVISRQWK